MSGLVNGLVNHCEGAPTMTAASPMILHGPTGPVTYPIHLKVYDISRGIAKQCTGIVLGKKFPAVYHTGFCVYGREYWFGPGGIMCAPDEFFESTNRLEPMETFKLYTNFHQETFEQFLREKQCLFTRHTYNLAYHNCNNFANMCANFLTCGEGSIPGKVLIQPQEIALAPHAYRFLPLVDIISKSMSGTEKFDVEKTMKLLALDQPKGHRWGMSKVGQNAFRDILEAIHDSLNAQTQMLLILNPFGEGHIVKLELPPPTCEDYVEESKTNVPPTQSQPWKASAPAIQPWSAPAPAIVPWSAPTIGRVAPPHADV